MSKGRKKAEERPVFDSIRKPVAPPTQKFGDGAHEEKRRPALRKTKHKRPPDTEE